MVTYDRPAAFVRQFQKLTRAQQRQFLTALGEFVAALRDGSDFPPGLRIKRVKRTQNMWEMTWAADGRATFRYGDPARAGEAHIEWVQIGSHSIL